MKKNSGKLSKKIEGLNKAYWKFCGKNIIAIDNLYLSLEQNEKFGLLGYNGSGKTSIFKSITNEILYDSGKISLFGYNNKKDFNRINSKIGYCPSLNPLFDFMKVKEIIQFYLELKTSKDTAISICKKFGLDKYLNTYCINLSGGNKRKLALAIALLKRPNLLLLDEPCSGVVPLSRRIIWKNINELFNNDYEPNMILTTHSMKEAEILCDRVGWVKEGNFICIGNPEELEIQYSSGYILYIKFDNDLIESNINENENNMKIYDNISILVSNFDDYYDFIMNHQKILPYIKILYEIINKIKPYTEKIELNNIGKNFSIELIIEKK